MNSYEVAEPILSSPFAEPPQHWYIREGEEPERRQGRRPAVVFPPRDQRERWDEADGTLFPSSAYPGAYDLCLVNLIRQRVADWRQQDYPGVTRTTLELLRWWGREGRQRPLFFAQREAAETIIFLTEARQDFLQGITVPRDEPSDDQRAQGFTGFRRCAAKMATGAGKTTVMAMLAAWSILNKLNDRNDGRFSDVVLVVCPNVTIRDRLRELDPRGGEASLYRTRDLVPVHLMSALTQGHVLVTNWHVFEPQGVGVGGDNARVVKAGRPVLTRETITIGAKTTTARGTRYLTLEDFERQRGAGLLTVRKEHLDKDGALKKVEVESYRYVESDTALVNRLLDREVGGKRNILVMNDEAHHAYRLRREAEEDELFDDEEEAEEFVREATVWVEGLDRIHKLRSINFCIDLSATPYYLGAVGRDAGRPFPWVVSDFGLIDAIESGLVKVPQLAVRDVTGAATPAYFNIWQWIMPQLTTAERGGRKANPKPEAILKYANHPIAMLGGLWEKEREEWEQKGGADPRPPVFILVCKNTQLAKVVYEWLAKDVCPANIPSAKIEGFLNRDGCSPNTIRVDSKVVHETDTGEAKSDESRWMRFTLDTVGKVDWPADSQGRPIYPEGFEELAQKLERPLHPPGRDVRCIVSVGMLTEGWDCLDRETEILTPSGWVGWGMVSAGDLVYSLNRDTGKLEIVPVLEYGERPVRPGERMFRIKSQHLDIRTTEGHHFHIKYRDPRAGGVLSRTMLVRTGAQLALRRSAYALPLAAEMTDSSPGVPLSDDEIRLVAWFMTDGGFSNGKLLISQAKEYHREIRALLQGLKLDYREKVVLSRKGSYPHARPLHVFRVPKGTHSGSLARSGWSRYAAYLDKSVAPALHLMTRSQFLLFWNELLKGDGERQGDSSGWLWCNWKEQADAYTHMAVVRGLTASCHPEITEAGETVYRVSVRDSQWITSDPLDKRASRVSLEIPEPNERVWCVRNRNSTLVTRRNGKIVILGNCCTVTHIIGLRPFMSQLLCEQVVGRGLRRRSYEVGDGGLLNEEVAQVLGVPFEVIPFKATKAAPGQAAAKRYHVHPIPSKAQFEIRFPRVEGYTQKVRNRVTVNWPAVPALVLEPGRIPPEVEVKALNVNNQGRLSLSGPGRLDDVKLTEFRARHRLQELVFDMARALAIEMCQGGDGVPAHALFPQLAQIIHRYLTDKVLVQAPADVKDVFLSPYYGWVMERLRQAIRPDTSQGEDAEVPRYEKSRGPGSTAEVDYWTSKDVREVRNCHLNYVVADTAKWEQSAAYLIDKHPAVAAFVKNAGLGFAIPYLHNGQDHDYYPDFLIRLKCKSPCHVILETKGYDPLEDVKRAAAERWVAAVNAEGSFGHWQYVLVKKPSEIGPALDSALVAARCHLEPVLP